MSFLFGSAPKASFSTQPTIQPSQQDLLTQLQSILGGGPGTAATNVGATSLAALESQALGVPTAATGPQAGVIDQSFNTLSNALNYQPLNVTPTAVTPTSVTAQAVAPTPINATQAFQQGVVDPMTQDFLAKTLPAIAGQQGGSAGGAYSSGAGAARGQAATDLERTLSQTGAQYNLTASEFNANQALQAATTNAANALTAGTANQNVDLAAQGANQSAGLTAQTANQGASLTALQRILTALGIAPTVATAPETIAGSNIGLSTSTLAPYSQLISELIAGGTGATQQTLGVGSGGSTGLLGGLIGGAGQALSGGGTAALLTALGLSDERAKEDIEEVGSVEGFPLYRFRYKGQPERQIGMMAQDVEKRLPEAVGRIGPLKTVNYAAVLEHLLEAA